MSSAFTVFRPACEASVVASLLTRTAYSSRIRRISSTASSPTRSAPAFSISRRTAAVESSPFRIKTTRKEFEIPDSIKVCHFSAAEADKALLCRQEAAFEPFPSTLPCQLVSPPRWKRNGNMRCIQYDRNRSRPLAGLTPTCHQWRFYPDKGGPALGHCGGIRQSWQPREHFVKEA